MFWPTSGIRFELFLDGVLVSELFPTLLLMIDWARGL